MQPLVAIIVLNWNGWRDTLECLESLFQINYPHYQVVLVDNNSEDGSLDKVRDYCQGHIVIESKFIPEPIKKPIKLLETTPDQLGEISLPPNASEDRTLVLIKNPENYGFAKGNNIGIEYAIQELDTYYTLLLNNDTVVDKDFLTEMVKVAESDGQIGLVGAKIYYYDLDARSDAIWCVGGKINLERYPGHYAVMDTIDLKKQEGPTVECDWVSGAAMLIKTREVPDKYLNESFFFGCEDADLALRLKKHGYRMITALNAKVWHKVASSRKQGRVLDTTVSEIKTSLKFIKTHKKNYNRYIPLYLVQIVHLYSKWALARFFKN
jgi:GT2 family glycosyltransferase